MAGSAHLQLGQRRQLHPLEPVCGVRRLGGLRPTSAPGLAAAAPPRPARVHHPVRTGTRPTPAPRLGIAPVGSLRRACRRAPRTRRAALSGRRRSRTQSQRRRRQPVIGANVGGGAVGGGGVGGGVGAIVVQFVAPCEPRVAAAAVVGLADQDVPGASTLAPSHGREVRSSGWSAGSSRMRVAQARKSGIAVNE